MGIGRALEFLSGSHYLSVKGSRSKVDTKEHLAKERTAALQTALEKKI